MPNGQPTPLSSPLVRLRSEPQLSTIVDPGSCTKCGAKYPRLRHRPALAYDTRFLNGHPIRHDGEYLEATCSRCRYQWMLDVLEPVKPHAPPVDFCQSCGTSVANCTARRRECQMSCCGDCEAGWTHGEFQ